MNGWCSVHPQDEDLETGSPVEFSTRPYFGVRDTYSVQGVQGILYAIHVWINRHAG